MAGHLPPGRALRDKMMPDSTAADAQWHLDKRVPIALIMTIVLQTAGIVAWATKLDTRVAQLEQQLAASRGNGDRLTRLESKLDAQGETLTRIDRRLERFEDRPRR